MNHYAASLLSVRALALADHLSHRSLDWYISRQWPGWGHLQLWQWYLCNASERWYDRYTHRERLDDDKSS